MKNFLITLIFSFCYLMVNAQQDRFIYLQTENKQPFFVKFDNKVFNSTPLGYLIIPKLSDGLYSLILGFPETTSEQEFNCSINKKDIGFIIKKTAEDQAQLLNVQTLNVIVPANVIVRPVTVYEKETDLFSTMLANAVHDSTILQKDATNKISLETSRQIQKDTNAITANPVVTDSKPENPSKDTVKKEITVSEKPVEPNQKDTSRIISANMDVVNSQPATVLPIDSAINNNMANEPLSGTAHRSSIKRKLRKVNKDGIEMMYVDEDGGIRDTIRILIPVDKKKSNKEVKVTEPVASVPVSEKNNPENESNSTNKIREEKEPVNEDNKQAVLKSVMINSDCKSFASDEDFIKLRKKMVAEDNDEDMIKVAKKVFKTKCFVTEQIKNLSTLFLKDEGKYIFFDTAYPFVSDSDLYSALEKQLSDEYYITRFRAMIHK